MIRRAVLFDLDGTVLDTAPDLLVALNCLRERRGLGPFPLAGFRARVSRGARAMLGAGLPGFVDAGEDGQGLLVNEFLDAYQARIYRDTVLFPGMDGLLDSLARQGVPLAIVTNKPEAMACELLAAMNLARRFPVVLGGDSLAERKPHPLPVRTACERLGIEPAYAWMVGDDRRDIEAGRAAGCRTAAVDWGYAPEGEPGGWGADAVVSSPGELVALTGA